MQIKKLLLIGLITLSLTSCKPKGLETDNPKKDIKAYTNEVDYKEYNERLASERNNLEALYKDSDYELSKSTDSSRESKGYIDDRKVEESKISEDISLYIVMDNENQVGVFKQFSSYEGKESPGDGYTSRESSIESYYEPTKDKKGFVKADSINKTYHDYPGLKEAKAELSPFNYLGFTYTYRGTDLKYFIDDSVYTVTGNKNGLGFEAQIVILDNAIRYSYYEDGEFDEPQDYKSNHIKLKTCINAICRFKDMEVLPKELDTFMRVDL